MRILAWPLQTLALCLSCVLAHDALAQETDAAVTSAEHLLRQATRPQRDSSHNAILRGLRTLEDPALLPLFNGLVESPYRSMRIHGTLGAAALSPARRVDLASLAEIQDKQELVQVLSAAIDDGLIDDKAMATLLAWRDLDLPLRQAIALPLIGAAGQVDTTPFSESLDAELSGELSASRLLQYGLAGLLLAENGDEAGQAALRKLATLDNDAADAVIGQTLDAAMRQGLTSAGPLALRTAKDTQRAASLRLLAIQAAMRLGHPDAPQAWQSMFTAEEGTAQRIRLAMIALDASERVEPGLFDTLENNGEWIGHIARAGRAIASKDEDLAKAFKPLIATGQPLSVQWVVTYCQRREPRQGPELLEQVIRHHSAGPKHHRGRMKQAAISATTALCELYPQEANARLARLLNDAASAEPETEEAKLLGRQIILFGIAQSQGRGLQPLAAAITPDDYKDFSTRALRIFIRARHGVDLTQDEWSSVSDIVQGVGQFDPVMRSQLGWAYLKHQGVDKPAIQKALR